GDEDCAAAAEGRERHGGYLPVPVDGGVHEKGAVRARHSWNEGMPSGAPEHDEWGSKAREQQHEPDRPELRERPEVEAVSVTDLGRDRALPKPVLLIGSGARAEPRVRRDVVGRDTPECDASVAREAEQALVEAALCAGRRSGERVPGLPDEL